MLIHIDMVKIISYIGGINGLHTSCSVSYVNEHQSDYHGIIWFIFFVLLILCAVNPLLTGGFPYIRLIVRNFAVWLMLFALLVERWCLIKGFRIAGPVCGVFICSQWILLTNEAKLWCLLSYLSERAVEQTVDMQVSRELMKLRLCYCDVICHSVIDDIVVPVCGETIGHLWIPVARGHWSGALEVWCAAIPSPVDSPHKRLAWCFLSCLPLRAVQQTLESPFSWNPRTRMRCHCYVSFVNPAFRMVEH